MKSLRTQLTFSHLKVLLAFVVIHLFLFIVAIQLTDRKTDLHTDVVEALKTESAEAKNLTELLGVAESFAQEKSLVVEVESGETGRRIFGSRGPGTRGRPIVVPWRGEDLQVATLRLREAGRPGPPTRPIVHVILTTLLAGIVSVLLAFRSSKAVSSPIAELIRATEQLEAGRDEEILLTLIEGPQEIQNLANSFGRMSTTLSANLKKLREERDRAEASEASRRQLIADVSHNLRTPLAAAVGWLDSLIDGHVEDQQSCLRQVRRETLWAAQRLERLLRLSRWEHSEPMMTLRSVSLSDIVLEVAENLEDRASEVDLSLELNIAPGLNVRGDRHHLRDLIQILLENIIEHSGESRQATVKANIRDDEVEISVTDDGPGFDPDFLGGWAGEPLVAKTGRVSLGLAIARRLAEAHGSQLMLSNRDDGTGTVARFTLAATLSGD